MRRFLLVDVGAISAVDDLIHSGLQRFVVLAFAIRSAVGARVDYAATRGAVAVVDRYVFWVGQGPFEA